MKGILDTNVISYYKDDFKQSLEAGIEAEKPELNIKLLESRLEVLKEQEQNLTSRLIIEEWLIQRNLKKE